ncbi:MAG TPA: alpha-ketoacid dehydrogenase subunit beta [Acidobacteriota bacterium]|nr:alpha-ketoacid dehydrogenase subunit beta [Acidobacteriota bacterium]
MRLLRGNQALCEALTQEMTQDERVFVMGEDVAAHGGIYRVTEGLLTCFGPTRVMDTPISESGFVGLAVGAAMLGMRPVVEIMSCGWITVAMDQIVNSAAKVRYVNNGGMHVPVVIRTVISGSGNVYTGQELEAWFFHVPGLKVVAPSNPYDAKGLLISSIRDPDPVIFFEHKSLYSMRGEVPEETYVLPFGQAKVRREGSDVTVVAYSGMVAVAEEAAHELAGEGVEAEVIDPRTLVPFDKKTIVESVCKTGRLVVVHESVRRGGVGAEIAAAVIDSDAFGYLRAPILRVTNPGVPIPFSATLRKIVSPGKDEVVAAVRRVMAYA